MTLVERLREIRDLAAHECGHSDEWSRYDHECADRADEAADRIEALEAALKIIESEIMPEIPNSKGWKYTPAEVAGAALAERNE